MLSSNNINKKYNNILHNMNYIYASSHSNYYIQQNRTLDLKYNKLCDYKILIHKEDVIYHELKKMGVQIISTSEDIRLKDSYKKLHYDLVIDNNSYFIYNLEYNNTKHTISYEDYNDKLNFNDSVMIDSYITQDIIKILLSLEPKSKQKYIVIFGGGVQTCNLIHPLVEDLIKKYQMTHKVIIYDYEYVNHYDINNMTFYNHTHFNNCDKSRSKAIEEYLLLNNLSDYVSSNFTEEICENVDCIILTSLYNDNYIKEAQAISYKYKIPLIVCDTYGYKSILKSYIPDITKPFTIDIVPELINQIDYEKPLKEDPPLCVIQNYPTNISHCIKYSIEFFENKNDRTYDIAKKIYNITDLSNLTDSEINEIKPWVNLMLKLVETNKYMEHENCYTISSFFTIYLDLIKNIEKITTQYPKDNLNSEGELFWNNKKYPTPLNQVISDDKLYEYIDIIANLEYYISDWQLRYITKDLYNIILNIDYDKEINNDSITEIKNKILRTEPKQIYSHYYEFDCKKTEHLEFIMIITKLRALVYDIIKIDEEVEISEIYKHIESEYTKPNLITTINTLNKCIINEIYKIIFDRDNTGDYIIDMNNLDMNIYKPHKDNKIETKYNIGDLRYDIWSVLEFNNMTLQEFINELNNKINRPDDEINISIMSDKYTIYNPYMNKQTREIRLTKTLSDIYKEIYKTENINSNIELMIFIDITDEETDIESEYEISCIIKL